MPKVLSIKQPWASMIVRGLKRFEIRTWTTSYRGQLIIHASSATPTTSVAEEVFEDRPDLGALMAKVGIASLDDLRAPPRSAIVGVVTLDDVLDMEAVQDATTVDDASVIGELDDENFYWRLSGAVEIKPVSDVKGKLNLWELDTATWKKVQSRLTSGTRATFKSNKEGAAPAEWEESEDEDDADFEESQDEQRQVWPSCELAAVVGPGPQKRADVVGLLWSYIQKHGLQDTKNRRMINADTALRKVVGRARGARRGPPTRPSVG